MVVCKFFLQGTCKFGDYCRFQHQAPNTFDQSSASILRQSNFNAAPQSTLTAPKIQNTDTNTLVKSVSIDMLNAEKGGQWLLSCYGPLKEKPCFPGFSDQSFEEVRFGFLEAQKNGTIEQYKQQLNGMLQEAIMKTKALQNPTPELINMLKNIYNTPNSSSFGNANTGQQNVFGANNQTPFGPTNQSVFANTSSNIFSGSGNAFGGTTQNLFSNPASNSQNNIFAQNTSNKGLFSQANQTLNTGNSTFAIQPNPTIFGGTQTPFNQPNTSTNSVFGGVQANISASSVFGGTPQASASQGIFGSNQQVQTPLQNVFVKPMAQTQPFTVPMTTQPLFAASTQQNQIMNTPFAGIQPLQASNPNVFATQPQQPMNNPSMSIMNNTPNNIPQNIPLPTQQPSAFQHSSNIFGVPQQQNSVQPMTHTNSTPIQNQAFSNVFGLNTVQAPKNDESLYSKLEDLNEMEIKWFNSDELDMYNIPEKPPTYEMSYKT